MKLHDPSIKIVLCGGSSEWDKVILEEMNKVCDFLSVHIYTNAGGSIEHGVLFKNINRIERRIKNAEALVNSYQKK